MFFFVDFSIMYLRPLDVSESRDEHLTLDVFFSLMQLLVCDSIYDACMSLITHGKLCNSCLNYTW